MGFGVDVGADFLRCLSRLSERFMVCIRQVQRLPWEEALLLWTDHPFQTVTRVLAVRSFKCPLEVPENGVSTEGWPSRDWPGVDSLDC